MRVPESSAKFILRIMGILGGIVTPFLIYGLLTSSKEVDIEEKLFYILGFPAIFYFVYWLGSREES